MSRSSCVVLFFLWAPAPSNHQIEIRVEMQENGPMTLIDETGLNPTEGQEKNQMKILGRDKHIKVQGPTVFLRSLIGHSVF